MNEIVRGTTPTISFGLHFPTDLLETGFVTVKQREKVIIEKGISDCKCSENTLAARLTQEDTLALEPGIHAYIRLVVKTTGGDRLETGDYIIKVSNTHKGEVI